MILRLEHTHKESSEETPELLGYETIQCDTDDLLVAWRANILIMTIPCIVTSSQNHEPFDTRNAIEDIIADVNNGYLQKEASHD